MWWCVVHGAEADWNAVWLVLLKSRQRLVTAATLNQKCKQHQLRQDSRLKPARHHSVQDTLLSILHTVCILQSQMVTSLAACCEMMCSSFAVSEQRSATSTMSCTSYCFDGHWTWKVPGAINMTLACGCCTVCTAQAKSMHWMWQTLTFCEHHPGSSAPQ